jgi:hypothetical protein
VYRLPAEYGVYLLPEGDGEYLISEEYRGISYLRGEYTVLPTYSRMYCEY